MSDKKQGGIERLKKIGDKVYLRCKKTNFEIVEKAVGDLFDERMWTKFRLGNRLIKKGWRIENDMWAELLDKRWFGR